MAETLGEQKTEDELWLEYKKTKSPALRDKFIRQYMPLVKYVAGKMSVGMPSSVEFDDLVGFGQFGLLDAINKFEPDKNVKFKTYAVTRIRGAIFDELRQLDWIPRSIRQKAREIEDTIVELEAKFGRTVTDAEVASQMGLTEDEYQREVMKVSGTSVLSLNDVWYSSDDSDNLSIGDSIENIKNNTDKLIETANDMNNTKDIVVGTLNELENVNRNIGLDIDGVNKQIEITSACIRNIQSAIDNIKAITKQTNLLSLNARIEASRVSREIGRGFAVVAEEISSLADESTKSSNEIDSSLNELLTNYSLIVEKMTKTTSNINNQNSKLSDTKIAFETLDDDIKGTINKINDINTMVETLNDDRKQILDKTYSLFAIVQESSASCEEVNASCEEFIATVQAMCNNINEVKNKSESLNNSVKVFKI